MLLFPSSGCVQHLLLYSQGLAARSTWGLLLSLGATGNKCILKIQHIEVCFKTKTGGLNGRVARRRSRWREQGRGWEKMGQGGTQKRRHKRAFGESQSHVAVMPSREVQKTRLACFGELLTLHRATFPTDSPAKPVPAWWKTQGLLP